MASPPMPTVVDWPSPASLNCAMTSLVSDAERDRMPTLPRCALPVAMTPILQTPGARMPCEFGPTRIVEPCFNASRTRIMSRTGTRSVSATTSGISASIASIIAFAARSGGTKSMLALAPVSAMAEATVSKTGRFR